MLSHSWATGNYLSWRRIVLECFFCFLYCSLSLSWSEFIVIVAFTSFLTFLKINKADEDLLCFIHSECAACLSVAWQFSIAWLEGPVFGD